MAIQNIKSRIYFFVIPMAQSFAILYYILILTLAFFWFFLIREFNKKTGSKFPSVLYGLISLIPIIGHCGIAWSFLKDLKEFQLKSRAEVISIGKIYVTRFLLPDIFLVVGSFIFVLVGIFFFTVPVIGGTIGNIFIWLAPFVQYLSFIWLAWGFWSVYQIVRKLTPANSNN